MKIILRILYWILFALAFIFELLSSVTWALNEGMEWLDDKLLDCIIKLGDKIDKDE